MVGGTAAPNIKTSGTFLERTKFTVKNDKSRIKLIMFHHVSGKNPLVFLAFSECECRGKIFLAIRVRYGGGVFYLAFHSCFS